MLLMKFVRSVSSFSLPLTMKMMVRYALSCDVVKNFSGMSRSVFAFAHAPCFLRRCGSGYCFSSSAGEILRKGDLQLGNASAGGERSVVLEEESELEVKRHQVGGLDVSFPTYMVWGANTGVGKTLVSAGLSAAIVCQLENTSNGFRQGRALGNTDLLYVKPVQTGFPLDSDARYVFQEVSRVARLHPQAIPHGLFVCNHTLQVSPAVHRSVRETDSSTSSNSAWGVGESLSGPNGTGMKDLCSYESQLLQGVKIKDRHEVPFARSAEFTQNLSRVNGGVRSDRDRPPSPSHFTCQTMWSWFDPVSPHLAAAKEGSAVSDLLVLDSLQSALGSLSSGTYKIQQKDTCDNWMRKWAIVETAGGVASPGPSGTLQCDLYRPLRLPGVLVGDGRLGGISTTIGAYEMLRMRGYDIPAVILVDAGLSNQEPLLQYLQHKIPVLVLPSLPEDPNKPLADWFSMANRKFAELRDVLEVSHLRRMERLEEMSRKAHQSVWWPFTQHSLVAEDAITVIDSRSGENFSVYKGGNDSQNDVIETQFDACASWWTQGPDATLQPELAREAAYSAGRYGHVMFPENVHEPALRCAELLLQGVGQGWAERVFFSDNGATSIEVAIKMAFRRFVVDHCMEDSFNHEHKQQHFKVLALKGSYHGDTLGALEAQAPSAYTGFLQQPWYSGRGLFLEPPTVFLQNGRWRVHLPENYCSVECSAYTHGWKSRDEIFDMGRDATPLADVYSKFIEEQLTSLAVREETTSLAALIIEPVIHGAGGMEMLDPLFQRVLICACQRRHIPVIFDEVLSGCWRLGAESAAELLGCTPDIACYSKLLTGGLVPLAATLATSSVFEAFRGDSKLDALLHGHSYTAHAVGCSSAVISLQYFSNPAKNPNLLPGGRRLRELWSSELVSQISSHHAVQRVVSLGTIFALELQASDAEAGYASMVSKGLVEGLRRDGIYTRPLGNVVYLMCGPLTKPETCTILLRKLLALLK